MYALSLFAGSLLNALTKSVWTWICCGCPPAPSPTNQRMIWPPFGPGTLASTGAGVTSGVGDGVAPPLADGAAATSDGAAVGVAPPHAATIIAIVAARTPSLARLERCQCIGSSSVCQDSIDLTFAAGVQARPIAMPYDLSVAPSPCSRRASP